MVTNRTVVKWGLESKTAWILAVFLLPYTVISLPSYLSGSLRRAYLKWDVSSQPTPPKPFPKAAC